MSDITASIIQKVKDELDIQEELAPAELYDLLHRYRNSQHPYRFTDTSDEVSCLHYSQVSSIKKLAVPNAKCE